MKYSNTFFFVCEGGRREMKEMNFDNNVISDNVSNHLVILGC